MTQLPQPPALDVTLLLEQSRPRARRMWLAYGAGAFLVLVIMMAFASSLPNTERMLMELLVTVVFLGMMGAFIGFTMWTVRRHREEQSQIEAAGELVQLRRWPEAMMALQGFFSRPALNPPNWVQGLLYLTSVLARYHRFGDALAVQDYLLKNVQMDEVTAHSVRLGRAMAMLREDHLLDADRAIMELRRGPHGAESGGLALVEMYRDVKTGHAAEAVETFQKKLDLMRQQLGHRVADAYILQSKALDMLGRQEEAAGAYRDASILSPVGELVRRYPEVASLMEKYAAAMSPGEGT